MLIFTLCAAVIVGPAIATLFAFDLTHFPDCRAYLRIANLDLHQNPVIRYRVIVPFLARIISELFGGLFIKLSPSYFTSDFSLALAFLIVNTVFMSLYGLVIYRLCRLYGIDHLYSICGILAMLTCRYTGYLAGLPMVDSLYCLVTAMILLAIKGRQHHLLVGAIFLGPIAKESFVLLMPVIFFCSDLSRCRLLIFFSLAIVCATVFRYCYEQYADLHDSALRSNMMHIRLLLHHLRKLFTGATLFKIVMTISLWGLAPLGLLLAKPTLFKAAVVKTELYVWLFVSSVFAHMLLSGSMERMFYLSMPIVCLVVAYSARQLAGLAAEMKEGD